MPIPRRVAAFARNQVGLARALWWALRGRVDVGPDDVALPYNGLDRAVLYAVSAIGLLETVIVHVLVGWPPLRWTLSGLGVYGLLAFLGFDLTMRQHPHLLRADELVLRFGHFRSVRVPLDHLSSVRKHVQNAHRNNVQIDDDRAVVSFMGGTGVELRFAPATEIESDGRRYTVDRVSFAADDPATAVALLRTRAPSAEC